MNKIRFIDLEVFKHVINTLKEMINLKANKEHKHGLADIELDDNHQFVNDEEKLKLSKIDLDDDGKSVLHNDGVYREIPSEIDDSLSSSTSTYSSYKIDGLMDDKAEKNHSHTEFHTHENKSVLDGVNAQKVNEWNAVSDKVDKVSGKGLSSNDYSSIEKEKLSNIEEGANKYVHPNTHGADMIVETPDKRFVSDKEKDSWNDKVDATYVDGMVGNVTGLAPETLNSLSKLASAIGNDPEFVDSITTEINTKVDKVDGKGLSSNDYTTLEKDKLDSVEEGANNYVHPNSHSANMITETTSKRFVSDVEKQYWNEKADVEFVEEAIAEIVGSAPETLNTLHELAEALGNDPNYTTTILNQVGNKVDKISGKGLTTNDYVNEDKSKVSIIQTGGSPSQYLSADGTYKEIIGTGTGGSSNWSDLADKPFENIDIKTLKVDDVTKTLSVKQISLTRDEYLSLVKLEQIDDSTMYIVTDDNDGADYSVGNNSTEILQKTYLSCRAERTLSVPVNGNLSLSKCIVQPYKFVEGVENIVQVLKTFDNGDNENFYYNNDGTEFNNAMKIKDTYSLSKHLNNGLYESDIVDTSEFLELYGIEV